MLKPIQLPSGKIIDLDKCLAIVPSSTSPNTEVVLSGIEHHLQIDSKDSETLRREIDRYTGTHQQNRPILLERDESAQKKLVEKLAEFNLKWNRRAAMDNAEEEAQILREILDAERPSGQKLYSEE